MAETEEDFAGHRRIERVGATTNADLTSGSLSHGPLARRVSSSELDLDCVERGIASVGSREVACGPLTGDAPSPALAIASARVVEAGGYRIERGPCGDA